MTSYLDTAQGRRIAYAQMAGAGPGIVFLGGFNSDMGGTKAQHLDAWAKAQGRAFLRLDYSGHGQSSGRFGPYATCYSGRAEARPVPLARSVDPRPT
ncbi:hypothetical protein LCGC14_2917510 [marine sediment metagenome]|uniref:Serine aminopeptidase S33 domain-containing protein n=1 Tax=marine sediment metagenome TaxID=412755 RepID=A0A0F8XQ06_9ZZZZ